MAIKSPYSQAAFTLLELIVVIVLLGIVSIFVSVRLPDQGLNADAQAQLMVSEIRYVQNLSQTRGVRYYLQRTSSSTYRIANTSGTNVINYQLGGGVTFGTWSNLPGALIAFDGQGTPYTTTDSPGNPLTVTATITLSSGSATRAITITPTTGQVSS